MTEKTKDQHFSTHSPDETRQLAARIIGTCSPGAILALHGDLGAGKTCFTQGVARALGITEDITSPTYTLIHEYEAQPPLFHIDLYRTDSPEEALNFGIDEYLESDGITLIEWAERAEGILPDTTTHIYITPGEDENTRHFRISTPAAQAPRP